MAGCDLNRWMLQDVRCSVLLVIALALVLEPTVAIDSLHDSSAALQHDPLPPLEPQHVEAGTCTPAFLVIGTQKGGTSSLHAHIRANVHPGLWTTPSKEQDFFNRWIERGVSVEEYLHRFPFVDESDDPLSGRCSGLDRAAERTIALGEVSPNYLPTWGAPERVAQHLPGVRLVVLLKHPALRAISAYNMQWQSRICKNYAWQMANCFTRVDRSREELMEDYVTGLREMLQHEASFVDECYRSADDDTPPEEVMYRCWGVASLDTHQTEALVENNATLWRGMYADQLRIWFKHFPAKRFLMWSSEDFEKRPEQHMEQLVGWLGLDPALTNGQVAQAKHHTREKLTSAPEDVKQLLLDFYRPHNQQLYELLRTKGFGSLADRLQAYWDVL